MVITLNPSTALLPTTVNHMCHGVCNSICYNMASWIRVQKLGKYSKDLSFLHLILRAHNKSRSPVVLASGLNIGRIATSMRTFLVPYVKGGMQNSALLVAVLATG